MSDPEMRADGINASGNPDGNKPTGGANSGPPLMKVWTREGFLGPLSVEQSSFYGPDFLSVAGPHAPRRAVLAELPCADESDAGAMPDPVLISDGGVRLSLSGRRAPMPFTVRNVEADELHFIQDGEVEFRTEVGVLRASRGDFVCIPRSIAYRYAPVSGTMRSLIVESKARFEFQTPYPVGVINYERDMAYAQVEPLVDNRSTTLVLKAWEGENTTFTLPYDPLALERHMAGKTPVWKLNLDQIQKLVSLPAGGPPYPFLGAGDGAILIFNMGDRPVDYRPPVHLNADYDELMLHVDGEWGACDQPGTLTWVPKGVIHHGVSAYTPEPHRSWLLEARATFRWSEKAGSASQVMETSTYGTFTARA